MKPKFIVRVTLLKLPYLKPAEPLFSSSVEYEEDQAAIATYKDLLKQLPEPICPQKR